MLLLPIVVFRLGCRLLGGFTLNFSRSVPLRTAELVRNGPAQGNANILFGFRENCILGDLYLIMPDRKFMFLDQTLMDGRELSVGQSSISLCLRYSEQPVFEMACIRCPVLFFDKDTCPGKWGSSAWFLLLEL